MAYVKLLECVIPVHFKNSNSLFSNHAWKQTELLKTLFTQWWPNMKSTCKKIPSIRLTKPPCKNQSECNGRKSSKQNWIIYIYIHTNTYSITHYSCRWQNRIDDLELLSSHKSSKEARKWFNHALAHVYCTSFATKKHWIFQNFAHWWKVCK